ncbi:MAG: response regulator [Elainella sp. Prado103]|jgi:DNA-binding response OmpR family regulator/HPt (histidine-containing phosphotransfer) domain-containing protein|nr:response regulator [Elainella sp. Prado103]
MKMLLIEDDLYTSGLLATALSRHHYVVDTVADGAVGLELATQWSYDLILLDLLLPGLNGLEICQRLRAQGHQTPILMLTSKHANEDVIAGLDAGADDYVPKSCETSQLLARVRALLRRSGRSTVAPVLSWGRLRLDPAGAQVTYDDRPFSLRPKEYSLLELFLRYPQRILSRSNIIDHLWSMEETPVEGSVTNLIKDLRQRLKSAGMTTDLIETVYGLGYRLKTAPAPDEVSETLAAKSNSESTRRHTSQHTLQNTLQHPSQQHPQITSDLASETPLAPSDSDEFRASLSSANLSSANLSSANLSSANLLSANLSSANLLSANLLSTNLLSTDDLQKAERLGLAAIQHIRDRFRLSLEQRLLELAAMERSLQTGYGDPQIIQEEVHKLAGGLGTFGYPRASEIAKAMECLLEQCDLDGQVAEQFAQLLIELRQELSPPQSTQSQSTQSQSTQSIPKRPIHPQSQPLKVG